MPGLNRRNLLKGSLALGAVAATGGMNLESATAAPYLAYTSNSFFKSPVRGAPINATRTQAFRTFMRSYPDQQGYPFPRINGISGNMWGTAFALGTASDPIWKLTGSGNAKGAVLGTKGFRAPAWLGSMLSGTNDSPLCVIDLASGFTMMCDNARQVGSQLINGTYWSITYHSSNGLDYRNPRSTDSRNFMSRGRISDAQVIRRDLVNSAIAGGTGLGHVLHLYLAKTDANYGFCHPMVGCEKRHVGGFGAEGERLRLRPDIDLAQRGLSGAALVVGRTLQEHGMYIGDNSGSQSAIKAEQDSSTRKNWIGTNLTRDCLKGFMSWDDFEVVQMAWQ